MSDALALPGAQAGSQDEPETAYDERLLLAQRTDAEINEAVLKPMIRTGKGFWALVDNSTRRIRWTQKVHFSMIPLNRTVTSGLSCSANGSGNSGVNQLKVRAL